MGDKIPAVDHVLHVSLTLTAISFALPVLAFLLVLALLAALFLAGRRIRGALRRPPG